MQLARTDPSPWIGSGIGLAYVDGMETMPVNNDGSQDLLEAQYWNLEIRVGTGAGVKVKKICTNRAYEKGTSHHPLAVALLSLCTPLR